jgi:hypothetical protein
MKIIAFIPRYNHRIRQMPARASSGLRIRCFFLICRFLILAALLPESLSASTLSDTARQLADRIAAITGPGAIALDITNRSSLDDKSVREISSALQAQLRVQGIRTASADQSMGVVVVVLSESLREYVWTAQISIGADQPRVALISTPRAPSSTALTSTLPITLRKTFLFSQEQPILDAALIAPTLGTFTANPTPDLAPGSRLLILDPTQVAIYRQQSGRWEPETSLPIAHARTFPRDARGRLFLRRDHLFDAYLPGVLCRSSVTTPLALNCAPSDDPWPLAIDDTASTASPRAYFAPLRNFFTGALSPGIGRLNNVPSFYSAAPLPRSNYTLWVFAAVDGSIHLVDGIADQAVRAGRAGSDLAAVRSTCGVGTQLLVSENGDPDRDTLRAYEIPDREPVPVSTPIEFDGPITALWPDAAATAAVAIVKRSDTGWYEANRISISCAN